MKKLSVLLSVLFLFTFGFISCNPEEEVKPDEILPGNFKVEIPSTISNGSAKKSTAGDTLGGDEIYEHLRTFIAIGEGAADIVQNIIYAIGVHGLNQTMSFSFTSDDDGRVKNVDIIENATFEGTTWNYQLTMTDAEFETNEDGGYAMQIFWNKSPIVGVAILKTYNLNYNDREELDQAMFRIDYSEVGDNGYEKEMTVYIADLPLADPTTDPYSISTLKMFAGKNGDIVEVFGNSNHPNAVLHSGQNVGFNWAFVAAGDEIQNIGIAEVGLPPSNLDSYNRIEILVDYSINSVFTNEINTWFMNTTGFEPNPDQLAAYLQSTEAPGYFNNGGFVAAGTAPGTEYSIIENAISELVPYNPLSVTNLKIEFKKETAK